LISISATPVAEFQNSFLKTVSATPVADLRLFITLLLLKFYTQKKAISLLMISIK